MRREGNIQGCWGGNHMAAMQTRFNGIKINIQRNKNLHLPNSKPTAACADVLNNLKDQRGSLALAVEAQECS